MKKVPPHDVIILGAGAAGLACARALQKSGRNFLVLEARDRVGGRVFSAQTPSGKVELGAEFLHGCSPLLRQFEEAGLAYYDVCERHYYGEKNLRYLDFWRRVADFMKKIPPGKKDQSVADFLASRQKKDPFQSLFAAFVEGFHAADLREIGLRGLSQTEESDDADLNGVQSFRPLGRYAEFFERWAYPGLAPYLRLQTKVEKIRRMGPLVHVHARSPLAPEGLAFSARALIVTLPLGVLLAPPEEGGPLWEPGPPPGLADCLAALRVGHVQRLTFTFRHRFWETLTEKPLGYFHVGAQNDFPSWWTEQPLRTPRLVAWQGGPKAAAMAGRSEGEKIRAALATLAKVTKKSIPQVSENLVGCAHHDWSTDPFSRGAYSYVAVGGWDQSKRLARPFAGNIFFAGEACAKGSSRGTVHGALASGKQAAELYLRARR